MVDLNAFTITCTGDACTGDTVYFQEAVFGGSFRKPRYLGDREIVAKIVKDSYGSAKQQHTFALEILFSKGYEALQVGSKTCRKARNVYRNWTYRLPWADESLRKAVLDEKHERGSAARYVRELRRESQGYYLR